MAVKTKAQLHSDVAALSPLVTVTEIQTIFDDVIDSYENIISEYTTAQRDLLTPVLGLKIFNTTSSRMELYNGLAWIACSQKPYVYLDCSINPNYAEGCVGDLYIIEVAGKIGGASGKTVYVGDIVYCIVKNAGGTKSPKSIS